MYYSHFEINTKNRQKNPALIKKKKKKSIPRYRKAD